MSVGFTLTLLLTFSSKWLALSFVFSLLPFALLGHYHHFSEAQKWNIYYWVPLGSALCNRLCSWYPMHLVYPVQPTYHPSHPICPTHPSHPMHPVYPSHPTHPKHFSSSSDHAQDKAVSSRLRISAFALQHYTSVLNTPPMISFPIGLENSMETRRLFYVFHYFLGA